MTNMMMSPHSAAIIRRCGRARAPRARTSVAAMPAKPGTIQKKTSAIPRPSGYSGRGSIMSVTQRSASNRGSNPIRADSCM